MKNKYYIGICKRCNIKEELIIGSARKYEFLNNHYDKDKKPWVIKLVLLNEKTKKS